MTLLHERGITVYSPNVFKLMGAVNKDVAKSYLRQVRECVSNDRLIIKTITAFGQPPAIITVYAKRLNLDLIVMSSHGRSGIRQRFYGNVTEKVLCGAPFATLVIREQEPIHENVRVRMKGV
jgi:nucleotide-binding universal stress UspA family protein